MLYAHGDARIFDRVVESLAHGALAVNLQAVTTEDLKVRSDRNVNVTVERVAKKRASLFFNADDPHRQAANLQRLSDCVSIWEKLVFDVAPQHHHQR